MLSSASHNLGTFPEQLSCTIQCYWQSLALGCQKINCPYFHKYPRDINGLFLPPTNYNCNLISEELPIHPPLIIVFNSPEDKDDEEDEEERAIVLRYEQRPKTKEEIEEVEAILKICHCTADYYPGITTFLTPEWRNNIFLSLSPQIEQIQDQEQIGYEIPANNCTPELGNNVPISQDCVLECFQLEQTWMQEHTGYEILANNCTPELGNNVPISQDCVLECFQLEQAWMQEHTGYKYSVKNTNHMGRRNSVSEGFRAEHKHTGNKTLFKNTIPALRREEPASQSSQIAQKRADHNKSAKNTRPAWRRKSHVPEGSRAERSHTVAKDRR